MGVLDFGGGKSPVKVMAVTVPQTASGLHVTGKCAFGGLVVKTDGANNVTLNVYDNTSGSGTRLLPADVIVLGSARLWAVGFDPGIYAGTGVYVGVAVAGGGTCAVQVLYDQG